MSAPGAAWSRCDAQDGLGNRCHKASGHLAGQEPAERRHDASRGALDRRWG